MAEEEQQDFSKLPLEDRASHKNWKARVSAYDELIKIFVRICDDKEWGKYGSWVRKFPTDSNAAAQEKALEVTLLYLENAALPQAGRIVGEVMSGVVSKCITASKAKSKELAVSIALMCVEVEKGEVVQEELMKGMEQKNPKVVAGCINIYNEILRCFGPKVGNLKTMVKKIPVLSEDRDKGVRDATKTMMVELIRWLGPAFKSSLSAVKPMVLQEVESELEKCTGRPVQTRYLRSQQAREERGAGEGDAEDEGGDDETEVVEAGPEIDPYDLLDPVDILSKIPKDFYEKCEAKKWQERKEAMEALEALVANPKLEAGDYSELVRTLKKIISKDTNVVVVALAGKNLAGLANGMKRKFSPYAASCISTILEKFKEKKANVVAAMREAIDASFVASNLEAIQEDVVTALQNKNPAVKVETNAFLARAFAKTAFSVMSDRKVMKPYFTAVVANLNESDPAVREAAAEALGVAMKHIGEKAMGPFVADMEAIKLQKVKEFMEKAVITAPKEKAAKPPPAKAAGSTAPKPVARGKPGEKKTVAKKPTPALSASTSTEDVGPPEKAVRPGAKPGGPSKVGSTAASRNAAASSAAKKTNAPAKAPEEQPGTILPVNNLKAQRISDEMKLRILKWNFTTPREEFIELLKELMTSAGISSTLMTNMFHSNFKLHLKALDTLQEELHLGIEGTKSNLDLILKWATLRFFDTNPSVLIRILDYMVKVFQMLGDDGYNMTDVEAGAFIPYLVLKLGESKENMRNSVHEIFRLLSVFYNPQRLFGYLLEGIKSKNARQRTDCLEEMSFMIQTHGVTVMNPTPQQALKEIAKQISDRDTNVRNAALNAVVQTYFIVGDKALKMIGNLTDKDQSLLDERIKRSGKRPPIPIPNTMPKPSSMAPPAKVAVANQAPAEYAPQYSPQSPPPPQHVANSFRSRESPGTGPILQPSNHNTPDASPQHEEYYYNRRAMMGIPSVGSDMSRNKNNGLPEKYRIDFEAIDNLFNDDDPMPPLELLETNIDQFVRGEQIKLPKRRAFPLDSGRKIPGSHRSRASTAEKKGTGPPGTPAEQSIDLSVSTIGSTDLIKATDAALQLEKLLTDSSTAVIMAGRVDNMLSIAIKQFTALQPTLMSPDHHYLNVLNDYLRTAVSMLSVLFKTEPLPRRACTGTLKEAVHRLLSLIIDENLEGLVDAPTIIRLINVMVVRIIENSDPNAITSALIRLMKDVLPENKPRLLELVMKCQWKLLKQHGVWMSKEDVNWDVKAVLDEYFSFLDEHPFDSFINKDGTPLKTVKTIVHSLIMHVGGEPVNIYLSERPGLSQSEGGNYLKKIVQRDQLKRAGGTTNLAK